MLTLSVAIVTFNSPLAQLRRTLQSLHAGHGVQTLPLQLSVTIVDNSCDAGYAGQLAELLEPGAWPGFSALELVFMQSNVGFGAAHNRAFDGSSSDYHLILNPDVELAEDALEQAISYMQADSEVVLVGPAATDESGNYQYLSKRYPSVLVLALRAFAPAFVRSRFSGTLERYEMHDVVSAGAAAPAELLSGCCLFARTASLRQERGFDPDYFMYFEDYDLSIRMARQGKLRYLPQVRIVHHGGYSARKGWRHIWMFSLAGARFFNRHGWRWI